MDHYHIWCDLRPGIQDLELVASIRAMLDHMQGEGLIESWSLQRRKLGFGPRELGQFHLDLVTRDLSQLEAAFATITPRSGDMERLHAAVWSKVTGFQSALYRDFPDANRA